jgi:hypothetical protein
MLTLADRLKPNAADVAAKVIEGEAILINLATGTYYSMDKAGALVWELIEAGLTLEQIAGAVTERYEAPADEACADVERLARELLAENLVAISTGDDRPSAPAVTRRPETKLPYEPPQLTTYTDMSDLLALDPPMPHLAPPVWDAAASE